MAFEFQDKGLQFAIFLSENWEPPLLSPSYILSWTTIVNISTYFKCILTAVHVKMKPCVTIQRVPRDLHSMYIYIHLVRLMKSSVSEPRLIRGWYFLKSFGNAILYYLLESMSPLFEHNLQTNKTLWNWTKALSNRKHPHAANKKKSCNATSPHPFSSSLFSASSPVARDHVLRDIWVN